MVKLDEGPSPRVRGKPTITQSIDGFLGSIPARAGETVERPLGSNKGGVHPRACGGNLDRLLQPVQRLGPSPRVRGKRSPRGW